MAVESLSMVELDMITKEIEELKRYVLFEILR